MAQDLHATLESTLPDSLPTGTGTAIFCAGISDAGGELELLVNGTRQRVTAGGMWRPDVAPGSVFWATLRIPAQEQPGSVELAAGAHGRRVPLGDIPVVPPDPPHPYPGFAGGDMIAICMATFDPHPELLRTQIESIREQTDDRWFCIISDDASSASHFERLVEVVGDDPRFAVSRSDTRLGFYRNFERGLTLLPAEAELVALCDQDDRWHPDKLATLRAALGDAQLVYSDQRLVDVHGRVLRDTLWRGRRNNHTNLASMLIANTVTGAASLFRREVADLMLPFPQPPGIQFHDQWLALVALSTGDIAYVDRPLYDYVQHRGAVFGQVTDSDAEPRRRPRARGLRETLASWRAAYFHGYLSREVQAVALLARCGPRVAPRKRRALERVADAARSPLAFAWLVLRPLRAFAGRTETLGSELELACGILWFWLARLPGPRRLSVAVPPPETFEQRRLRRWRAGLT